MSTAEVNLSAQRSLVSLVRSAWLSSTVLNRGLAEHDLSLVGTSYHPSDTEEHAYHHVSRKALYLLFRGASMGRTAEFTSGELNMLAAAWHDRPLIGRGFDHKANSLSAATHVWTRTEPSTASSHMGLVHALGWMFNLVGANSPLRLGQVGHRDSRIETWPRFLRTSRFERDGFLCSPLPDQPEGIADYFAWRLSFAPLSVPDLELVKEHATERPLVVCAPESGGPDWSFIDFLEADRVRVVGRDGGVRWIEPAFGHLCNGADWLYWPKTGGRLRILATDPGRVNAREFARAVRHRDHAALEAMLVEAGCGRDGTGALCVENRAPAAVIPTSLWEDDGWALQAMPYVLQAAVMRSHEHVWELLRWSGLSWHDLAFELPRRTNSAGEGGGFDASVKGVSATRLAGKIWDAVRNRLTDDELSLVGDLVDRILDRRAAPAELQLAFFRNRRNRLRSADKAVGALLAGLRMPVGARPPGLASPLFDDTATTVGSHRERPPRNVAVRGLRQLQTTTAPRRISSAAHP